MSEPCGPPSVAVVGAGPAGFYTAAALLKKRPGALVTLVEALPTPWGLLRSGVAPDHQNIRAVGATFDKIGATTGLTFAGNVQVGVDLTHADLLATHHAVVYAVGAPRSRNLGVAGEELRGVHPASDIVGWYNAHPDHIGVQPNLAIERAVVVGNGNVAIDVARMLLRRPEDLSDTDTASHAVIALAGSTVEEVVLLGRRGPYQAAFTLPELKELVALPDVSVVVDGDDVHHPAIDDGHVTDEQRRRIELLRCASDPCSRPGGRRRIVMKFFAQPVGIRGGEQVTGVEIARTRVDADGAARATETREVIPAQLVVSAVGFRGLAVPGVPFDHDRGIIPNVDGRVVDVPTDDVVARVYTAGWAKRGPSGVIGTNKKDANDTVALLLADYDAGLLAPPSRDAGELLDHIRRDGGGVVDFDGWRRIDAAEREAGTKVGRPRDRFLERAEMLKAAGARFEHE